MTRDLARKRLADAAPREAEEVRRLVVVDLNISGYMDWRGGSLEDTLGNNYSVSRIDAKPFTVSFAVEPDQPLDLSIISDAVDSKFECNVNAGNFYSLAGYSLSRASHDVAYGATDTIDVS